MTGCGVYYLWDGERVIYVGASRYVVKRLSYHAHNGVPFIQAFYDECEPNELADREAKVIKEFRPTLNVQNFKRWPDIMACDHLPACHVALTVASW